MNLAPLDSKMTESSLRKKQSKTQTLVKEQNDAKHRKYVLEQWLTTQINFSQDMRASIVLIKPKLLQYRIIDQGKANKLFPYFDEMLKISEAMIEIISVYKKAHNIADVMIGARLNKIVSYYKIYLQYFKHKSEIKALYEELEKQVPKELRNIETELRNYIEDIYKKKTLTKSKMVFDKSLDSTQKPFNNPKSNITIHDCLQRPLYRLFKYHLLIDSYLKKLPKTHPDFEPLKKTKQLFMEIGEKCNNSFTEQQRQDLKYKLQALYGRTLPQTSHYKTMMTADTLYFPCKLYIFSNLVIVSKAQKMIGFRQQKLYMNLGIDEFSFITYKKDMKYFKNTLILCGVYDCIHFFLPDKGTRLQIYHVVSKMIQEQRMKAFQKRQHKESKQANKLTFLLQEKESQATSWLTGIKLQVIDIDMRELGMFSSDTVFILSVCIPQYIDDQATFLKTSQIVVHQSNENTVRYNSNSASNQGQRSSMTKQEHIMTSRMGPVQYKKLQTESQFVKSSNYSTLNQHIQIHLPVLIEIYKDLRERFPQINFPQIDPLSKDFNFYTENKKKTKTFQVRSFLIQEFFNFVFRHPSIMENPLAIVSKIRIDEYMWDYVVARSFYLQNQKRDEGLNQGQTAGNKYDQNHCQLCRQAVVDSVGKFEQLRQRMIKMQSRRPENYCFNFYNLVRNNVLGLTLSQFDSIERMLIYTQYLQGRLDLAFLYKKNLAKVSKIITIMLPRLLQPQQRSLNESIFHTPLEISIDHKTTVGMVANSIARDTEVFNMFDYRLVISFNQQERILDQDQFLCDLIQKYQLPYEQKKVNDSELQFVGPRNSYRQPSLIKTTMGMFSMIKNLLPISKNQATLFLKKIVYFPLYLQIESMKQHYQRSELINAQILYKISKNTTMIPFEIWGEVCGLYYCQLNSNQLLSTRGSINTQNPAIYKTCLDILPKENYELIKAKAFTSKMHSIINERKKYITSLNNQTEKNFLSSIHQRVLELGYKYFKINTCFTPVEAKRVPSLLVLDSGLLLEGQCYIGVNHSEIVVLRDKKSSIETIRMPLEDVDIVHSVYSLFLTYRREGLEGTKTEDQKIDEFQLRFDSKMLHGFVRLCEKYKLLKNKFEALLGSYEDY